jgi:HSP20 family molecular chaperone IbpA
MFLCLREVALEHFSVHRGDDLLAIMELPGVDKNDLQIQAKANTIRISVQEERRLFRWRIKFF